MAGSIKLFSFNQKYCQLFGIRNGPSINWRNWIFMVSFVVFALPSAVFFVCEAKSMLEYGTTFYATSTGLFLLGIYLVMIWQMKNCSTFIQNCERFIEKRVISVVSYRELIEKIERLSKFVCIAFNNTLICATLPFLLYSIIGYYILDLGAESFLLLYPVKWPFDWKTPLGYFVAWLAQSAGIAGSVFTSIMLLNLIFGSCWLFMFMAEDITKDLAALNIDAKKNENHVKWTQRFCDIVQLYSDAKQCAIHFNAIVKYSLFLTMFYIMISISSTLLTLQFQILDDDTKLIEFLVISILFLWMFGTVFFTCELGERVNSRFEMFREELELCDWHILPINMQRLYLIFLSDTQQPMNITCYGNVLCVRDTFKKITKTGFSYFMTIRKFET